MNPRAGTVGLISNPSSGHNRRHFAYICDQLKHHPAILHRVTQSPGTIPTVLKEFADLNVTVLAINGGDGTVSAILGELLEKQPLPSLPKIALLPGGTANMNAGDIGVRGSHRKAVTRLCQWCKDQQPDGDIAKRALMRVAVEGAANPRYGMFLGGGAVIHGTEYAHREIHSRGLRDDFSLALGTLRTVWGVLRDDPAFNRHIATELKLDDHAPVTHDTLILALSTLHRLAFGMRPFWGKEPGSIRLTLMEPGCTRFARTFLSIIRGHPNSNAVPASGYYSHNANRITLRMAGNLNLDGELLDVNGRVDITASPELEFLRL